MGNADPSVNQERRPLKPNEDVDSIGYDQLEMWNSRYESINAIPIANAHPKPCINEVAERPCIQRSANPEFTISSDEINSRGKRSSSTVAPSRQIHKHNTTEMPAPLPRQTQSPYGFDGEKRDFPWKMAQRQAQQSPPIENFHDSYQNQTGETTANARSEFALQPTTQANTNTREGSHSSHPFSQNKTAVSIDRRTHEGKNYEKSQPFQKLTTRSPSTSTSATQEVAPPSSTLSSADHSSTGRNVENIKSKTSNGDIFKTNKISTRDVATFPLPGTPENVRPQTQVNDSGNHHIKYSHHFQEQTLPKESAKRDLSFQLTSESETNYHDLSSKLQNGRDAVKSNAVNATGESQNTIVSKKFKSTFNQDIATEFPPFTSGKRKLLSPNSTLSSKQRLDRNTVDVIKKPLHQEMLNNTGGKVEQAIASAARKLFDCKEYATILMEKFSEAEITLQENINRQELKN